MRPFVRDSEPPVCQRCDDEYLLRDNCEPTKFCDECSHAALSEAEAALASAQARIGELEARDAIHCRENG